MGLLNRFKKDKPVQPPSDKTIQTANDGAPEVASVTQRLAAPAMVAQDVVIRPLISEKAATLAGANQYVFIVRNTANRLQVREAIKRMYNVSPLSVNILNVKGKEKRFGRRKGTRSNWRKAIITLPKGETINVHEGV